MRTSSDLQVSFSTNRFSVLSRYDDKRTLLDPGHCLRVSCSKTMFKQLGRFLAELLCEHPVSVSVRVCDVEEMQHLNNHFRGKNKPTDVLSFPCDQTLEGFHERAIAKDSRRFLGDIAICLPVCFWQAKRARHSLSCEVERMLVHGFTHLLGYDHERSAAAWRVQSALEEALLAEIKRCWHGRAWIEAEPCKRVNRAK